MKPGSRRVFLWSGLTEYNCSEGLKKASPYVQVTGSGSICLSQRRKRRHPWRAQRGPSLARDALLQAYAPIALSGSAVCHKILIVLKVTNLSRSNSYSNENVQGTENTVRRGKRPAPGTKTPGAFLNNATRWPVYGRTSGMRCVIARAEHARDGGFASFRSDRVPCAGTVLQQCRQCRHSPISELLRQCSQTKNPGEPGFILLKTVKKTISPRQRYASYRSCSHAVYGQQFQSDAGEPLR